MAPISKDAHRLGANFPTEGLGIPLTPRGAEVLRDEVGHYVESLVKLAGGSPEKFADAIEVPVGYERDWMREKVAERTEVLQTLVDEIRNPDLAMAFVDGLLAHASVRELIQKRMSDWPAFNPPWAKPVNTPLAETVRAAVQSAFDDRAVGLVVRAARATEQRRAYGEAVDTLWRAATRSMQPPLAAETRVFERAVREIGWVPPDAKEERRRNYEASLVADLAQVDPLAGVEKNANLAWNAHRDLTPSD